MSSRDSNTQKMYSKFSDVSSSQSANSRVDLSDSKCAEKKDCTNELYDSGVISETCENLYSEGDIRSDPLLSSSDISRTDSKTDKQTNQHSSKDSGIDVMKSSLDMNVDSGFISEANIPCVSKSFESEKPNVVVEPKQEEKVAFAPECSRETLGYQDNDGNTVLHHTVLFKHEYAVQYVVFNAPSSDLLDIRNCYAQTCLHLAVLTNQPRIVRFLLLAGANPRIEDSNGNTALHLACEMNNLKCIDALCDKVGNSDKNYYRFKYSPRVVSALDYINEINYDGVSCLHIAAKRGEVSIFRKLMSAGANINIKEYKGGQTALHQAVSNGSIDLVELILSHPSVNIELENYSCHTAYQLSWSHPKISKLLLDKKALKLDFIEYELEDSESSDDSDVDEEYSHYRNDSLLNNFSNVRSEMVI